MLYGRRKALFFKHTYAVPAVVIPSSMVSVSRPTESASFLPPAPDAERARPTESARRHMRRRPLGQALPLAAQGRPCKKGSFRLPIWGAEFGDFAGVWAKGLQPEVHFMKLKPLVNERQASFERPHGSGPGPLGQGHLVFPLPCTQAIPDRPEVGTESRRVAKGLWSLNSCLSQGFRPQAWRGGLIWEPDKQASGFTCKFEYICVFIQNICMDIRICIHVCIHTYMYMQPPRHLEFTPTFMTPKAYPFARDRPGRCTFCERCS